MKHQEFFTRVSDRSGLSRPESSDVSRATLLALADVLDAATAGELADHLPDRLAQPLRTGGERAKQYDLDVFAGRVRRHAGLSAHDTAGGVTAVLMTLHEAAPAAAADAMSQLPMDFRTVGSGTVGSGTVGSGTVGSGTVGSGTAGPATGGSATGNLRL